MVAKRKTRSTVVKKNARVVKGVKGKNTKSTSAVKGVKGKTTVAVLKKPAAAVVEKEEAVEEPEEREAPNDQELARTAVKDVRAHQRLMDRITAENDKLALKMKENRSKLRQAEKVMDNLKTVATKHTRKLGAKRGAIMRKKMAAKQERAKAAGERAAEKFKKARKMVFGMRKKCSVIKEKASTAESAYKRALSAYEEAKKKCKTLKAQGEDVPDEGEKDVSAPGAYKPPGLRAAKERDALKATLPKLKEAYEKTSAVASVKLQRIGSLKEKMNEAQKVQETVEAALKEKKKAKRLASKKVVKAKKVKGKPKKK